MLQKSTERTYQQMAIKLLKHLVTSKGVYASTDNGWKGSFHAHFGRDSAITAGLIFSAERLRGRKKLSVKAYEGLLYLKRWQGTENRPDIGEEIGKITHEVRAGTSRNEQTMERIKEYQRLWAVDPKDGMLKNWDSVDSTPLWIIEVARWHEQAGLQYRPEVLEAMRAALEWCLGNLKEYGGLAGFIGADLQSERTKVGLHNQGWKDNHGAYQYADGTLAEHPIKDVFVNALFWAALRYGAEVFASRDKPFAEELWSTAGQLKRRFNNPSSGFLMFDGPTGLHYFAEAIDGKNQQLKAISADAALCLWAYHGSECVIDEQYIDDVVERIMLPDMLNPEAGMRNYSRELVVKNLYAGGYHRGPNTYWPFVSGLVVNGLDHFGYQREARQVAGAALDGVSHFSSCIEMFLEVEPHRFERWHETKNKQESATDQAWTAAAIYYITAYLASQATADIVKPRPVAVFSGRA